VLIRQGEDGTIHLVLLDVGLITELDRRDMNNFIALFTSIVQGNGKYGAELMLRDAREADISKEQVESFTNEMDLLFRNLHREKLVDVRVGETLRGVLAVVQKYRVKIEGNFAR
jgi:predicted unusual protein kinase regulating ubiquinone biosynthesis (AarF/ABC1/UbiB family)